MKSLVVGGAGFIGAHLVDRLLDEGREVAVLDPSPRNVENIGPDVIYFKGVAADRRMLAEAVRGAEEVYHLAAVPDLAWCEGNPAGAMEHNALSVAETLKAAVGAGVSRFVYASSWKVYGGYGRLWEGREVIPQTVYGVTKLIGEQVTLAYGRQHGLDATVLRLFNVYGPGAARGVVRAFVEAERAGCPLRMSDPYAERDFVHVRDAVEAFLQAGAEDHRLHDVYNVGTGRATSIAKLAHMVIEVTGVNVGIAEKHHHQGQGLRVWADTERARRDLGWRANVTLEGGLKEMLA